MSDIKLQRIRIYPIKGCDGCDVQETYMDERGLHYDRRWMLIKDTGDYIHQFDYPQLASISVTLLAEHLQIQAPGMPDLQIPLEPLERSSVTAIWLNGKNQVAAANSEADSWFQDFLHTRCQLVFMPDDTQHFASIQHAGKHNLAAFTGHQYHLLGKESVEDLNSRLKVPVPLERFRPNLVVSGAPAFAEDSWHTFTIGAHNFYHAKACERCAIITIDPVKGIMTGKEPLSTLARYRKFNKKIYFGQYYNSGETGIIHVGDRIEILEYQTPIGHLYHDREESA